MALVLRCEKHPAYTGKRKPKGSAKLDPDCWELYEMLHPPVVEGPPAVPAAPVLLEASEITREGETV